MRICGGAVENPLDVKVEKIKIVTEDGEVIELAVPEELSGQYIISLQQGHLTGTQLKQFFDIKKLKRQPPKK